jgi:hypothetical protein
LSYLKRVNNDFCEIRRKKYSALVALLQQPFGPWLLGLVALGLIAYGVYSFVEARYRRLGWSR